MMNWEIKYLQWNHFIFPSFLLNTLVTLHPFHFLGIRIAAFSLSFSCLFRFTCFMD
jgi:hypothetical protein